MTDTQEPLKVSSGSDPKSVAGAIAGMFREGKQVALVAMGAGAINQTVKAIATARHYLDDERKAIWFTVSTKELRIDKVERTAISFLVFVR